MVAPKRRVFIDVTPLRQSRDLRVLLGGQLVSLLGTQLTAVAVPYQVYRLTHSSLDVGLVSLAQLVPLLLCSLYGGTVIDATDRRKLLIRVEILPPGPSELRGRGGQCRRVPGRERLEPDAHPFQHERFQHQYSHSDTS